ncbi:MAG: DedA family protein [Verrucomicrobiales bacterium]|nr:DedA family protein [Verrucomicrobiales bacterium]
MEAVRHLIDIVLHLNRHLAELVGEYGIWVYGILFLIVFCETGLVVTPFLPGDSLLFAVGALCATGGLNPWICLGLLLTAAILGDTVNYAIGRYAGEGLQKRYPRLVRKDHLDRTHAFFEKYGGKTIIIARFVPIVRTFAPFVAGAGEMSYGRFMQYNVVGAVLWVVLCMAAGYFFGNLPFVQKNFSAVILGIIVVSILPAVFEVFREWRKGRNAGRKTG